MYLRRCQKRDHIVNASSRADAVARFETGNPRLSDVEMHCRID